MAQVVVEIAGRSYSLACKEGGEDHLRLLAADLGAKAERLLDQLGPMNEPRLLLMAALLLADELHDQRTAAPAPALPVEAPLAPVPAVVPAFDPALADALSGLADRAEALARQLEGSAAD
jgi:cell division protein ZapA